MKLRSMEEKISYRLFLMGFLGLIFTAVLCIFVFHKAFTAQAWSALERETDLVRAGYEQTGDPTQLSAFVTDDLRVTLISQDGSVLFESATDQPMENHLTRPEIRDAIANGEGRDIRDSQTMGYETYYYALRLSGGDVLRVAQDAETVWSIYDATIPAIVLSCVALMLAAAVLAALLTKALVQPVLNMTEDLDHIQENVPYRELIPFAESIHSDRILRENNEKMRQEFTANVSHELKTPLTVILTNTELLQSPDYDEAQKQQFTDGIRTMAQQMRALVERLLELARAENARPQAAFAPVCLSEIAETSALLFEAALYERGLTLETQVEPELTVSGDERQLGQLVEILLDNALKYASGGTVRLQLQRSGRHSCHLSLENEGPALSPQQLQEIFKRFTRADPARTRSGSFGLGLAIAQAIVQAHHGKIWAESRDGRNTFHVELPLRIGREKHQETSEKGI